jgi:hypothetical protein
MAKTGKQKQHVGFEIEKWLWTKIKTLASENDVNVTFIVKRALMDVALKNRIPWPEDPQEEARLREKWGAEVPTLDLDEEDQPAVAPAESAAQGSRKGP